MRSKITIRSCFHSNELAEEFKKLASSAEFIEMDLHLCENTVEFFKKEFVIPDVLVIELNANENKDIDNFIEIVQSYKQNFITIVLLSNNNAELVRKLMRAGVHDVFPASGNMKELVKEVEDIIHEKQAKLQSVSSKVISFLNAKGGVGATTVLVNTAYSLVTKLNASVCIIDLDIQFGDVALFLDLSNKDNIQDALRQPERIDSVFIKALIQHHSSGLDVLASPCNLSDTSSISAKSISLIIEAVSENYDFVLLDVPHSISQWTLEALRISDRNFLVIQKCLSVLRDAQLIIENLHNYGVDTSTFEIINNRDSNKTGSISSKQILETLNRSEMFNIRNNYSLAIEAQESGLPIEKTTTASGISRDIDILSKAIYEDKQAPHETGFLNKLFH